jgi:hypothetical protein
LIDADSKEYLRRVLEVNTPPLDRLTAQQAREYS